MESAAHVRVIEWINRGCNLYSRNFVLILVGVICAMTASIITAGALLGPMLGGIFLVLLKIIRRNEQNIKNLLATQSEMPIPADVFQGLEYFKPTMFVYVPLWLLCISLKFFLSQIPWVGWIISNVIIIILGTFTMFVIPFIVDQGLPPLRAIARNIRAVRTAGIEFVVFFFVVSMISSMTLILLWVGIIFGSVIFMIFSPVFLVSVPIYFCSVAVAYEDLFFE